MQMLLVVIQVADARGIGQTSPGAAVASSLASEVPAGATSEEEPPKLIEVLGDDECCDADVSASVRDVIASASTSRLPLTQVELETDEELSMEAASPQDFDRFRVWNRIYNSPGKAGFMPTDLSAAIACRRKHPKYPELAPVVYLYSLFSKDPRLQLLLVQQVKTDAAISLLDSYRIIVQTTVLYAAIVQTWKRDSEKTNLRARASGFLNVLQAWKVLRKTTPVERSDALRLSFDHGRAGLHLVCDQNHFSMGRITYEFVPFKEAQGAPPLHVFFVFALLLLLIINSTIIIIILIIIIIIISYYVC